MNPPFYSTFTLITELFVTSSVLYVFYKGYKENVFKSKLAFATIAYEILFNISYMFMRSSTHRDDTTATKFHIMLAASHGLSSLLMFVALIVFMLVAYNNYKRGVNFFKAHSKLSGAFLTFWMISVISGVVFYVNTYFFK